MSVSKGDTLPSSTLRELTENGPEQVSTGGACGTPAHTSDND